MPTHITTLTNIKKSIYLDMLILLLFFCSAYENFHYSFIVELYVLLKKKADIPSKKKRRPWREVNF